jgi:hypothetical protein
MPDETLPFRAFVLDVLMDPRLARLNWSQRGMFYVLLFRSWLDGGLPTDIDELAALLNVDGADFVLDYWPELAHCFIEREEADGTRRLVYDKQEMERRRLRHAKAVRDEETLARQLRAQRAAAARWDKKKAMVLAVLLLQPSLELDLDAELLRVQRRKSSHSRSAVAVPEQCSRNARASRSCFSDRS